MMAYWGEKVECILTIGKWFIPPKIFGNPKNPSSGSFKFPSVRMISNPLLAILGKDETPSAPMHLVTGNILSVQN